MTSSGLLLSTSAFQSLSASAQREVLKSIGLEVGSISTLAPAKSVDGGHNAVSRPTDGPVELTLAMVRKLTENLSDKTLTALKIIASSGSPQFHMRDVIEGTAGASNYMDVRAVWSALTRRTRKITDDLDADLIWWVGDEIYDDDDAYVDHVGAIAPLTYQSLRTHFGF